MGKAGNQAFPLLADSNAKQRCDSGGPQLCSHSWRHQRRRFQHREQTQALERNFPPLSACKQNQAFGGVPFLAYRLGSLWTAFGVSFLFSLLAELFIDQDSHLRPCPRPPPPANFVSSPSHPPVPIAKQLLRYFYTSFFSRITKFLHHAFHRQVSFLSLLLTLSLQTIGCCRRSEARSTHHVIGLLGCNNSVLLLRNLPTTLLAEKRYKS